jgi:hypothetical protein
MALGLFVQTNCADKLLLTARVLSAFVELVTTTSPSFNRAILKPLEVYHDLYRPF